MIRRKRVYRTGPDGQSEPVATFAFDGERLLAHYDDELFRRRCEQRGIAVDLDVVRTDRPAAFFDALDAFCARSSKLSIASD